MTQFGVSKKEHLLASSRDPWALVSKVVLASDETRFPCPGHSGRFSAMD